ncbi:MAG: hypothetical protein HY043_19205 [Verrucomicrobia bacterium]|nr:hypothetical protein [Verrucomicrobiota bacterium]
MTASAAFESISGSGDDFQQVVALCESLHDYCLIGGLAINCYVEPVYTMDADFALAAAHLTPVKQRLAALGFKVEDHPHSLNALRPGSQLSIQFTKDVRYEGFPARSEIRETLGLHLRVASLPDLVQAKIWAWSDPQRRLSKRKKDELDLIRVAEKYPQFIPQLPVVIRSQMS